jgi:PilZ domain
VSQTSTSKQDGTPKKGSRGNCRATIRYRCAPATVGKVVANADREFQRVWILNLSLRGVGMQLTRPLEAGQHVDILIKSNDGLKLFEMPAQVMHCKPAHGDWQVGCELTIPLTADELDQLL